MRRPRWMPRSLVRASRCFGAVVPILLVALAQAEPVVGQEPQPATEEPARADHQRGGPEHDHSQDALGAPSAHRIHGVHHDFSDAEHWSAVFDSPERDDWQRPGEVVSLMEIKPGMTVADLGAGTGYFVRYLSAAAGEEGRVLALEPEQSLVDFMAERSLRERWSNVEPLRIPYDDPGLEASSVDRLLVVNTWHHIGDRSAYAEKIRSALKPGGRVYIVDYTRDSPTGPPLEHRLPPEQILEELARGGLETELLEETLPRQFVVVGRRTDR